MLLKLIGLLATVGAGVGLGRSTFSVHVRMAIFTALLAAVVQASLKLALPHDAIEQFAQSQLFLAGLRSRLGVPPTLLPDLESEPPEHREVPHQKIAVSAITIMKGGNDAPTFSNGGMLRAAGRVLACRAEPDITSRRGCTRCVADTPFSPSCSSVFSTR